MTPTITLAGPSGKYQIQRAQVLGNTTNWVTLTNVTLKGSKFTFYDAIEGISQQFYRVQSLNDPNLPPPGMIWIQPGAFTMGSPSTEKDRYANEGPQTHVIISQGFWMSKYEVTQKEYLIVMGKIPSFFRPAIECDGEIEIQILIGNTESIEELVRNIQNKYSDKYSDKLNNPVNDVSWFDATNYCGKLTQLEHAAGRLPAGYIYRLPTEAEWEYACRAGTITRFNYGDDLDYSALGDYAWHASNSDSITHPVGQKQSNPWGLYDMYGNVWEWCLDWYSDSLPGGNVTDPKGPSSGAYHVRRGGSYDYGRVNCRSAFRGGIGSSTGFRPILAPGQ